MKKRTEYLSFDQILARMARFCAYRDRSTREVERKLDEYRLLPEARDRILAYLIQENFLDDERFARSYARGKFYQNAWGKRKIIQGLRAHGLTEYFIEKGLEEIPDEDYTAQIRRLIEKKAGQFPAERPPGEKKARISRYLYQKGYTYDDFKTFLDEAFAPPQSR